MLAANIHYIGVTDCAEDGVWLIHHTNEVATFTDFHPGLDTRAPPRCCVQIFAYNGVKRWAEWYCDDSPIPTICEINMA